MSSTTVARKVLVVEDEAIIARHLRGILRNLHYEVTAVVACVADALEQLERNPPDVVLIDVMLAGEQDGIDLAHRLRALYHLPFVFVTSLSDADTLARATQTSPAGYLVKPFTEQAVYVALELALDKPVVEKTVPAASAPPRPAASPRLDGIFVRDRRQLTKVKFAELLWLQADGKYTVLHTEAGRFAVSQTLKRVQEQLPDAAFIRVHKSYIVSLDAIVAIDGPNAMLRGGHAVPVGREYHARLMERLLLLGGE